MCIFLFRDGKITVSASFHCLLRLSWFARIVGTVITMHPDPNLDFTLPITQRLFRSDTTLRKSADPSLLVESLLDLGTAYSRSSKTLIFSIDLCSHSCRPSSRSRR